MTTKQRPAEGGESHHQTLIEIIDKRILLFFRSVSAAPVCSAAILGAPFTDGHCARLHSQLIFSQSAEPGRQRQQ